MGRQAAATEAPQFTLGDSLSFSGPDRLLKPTGGQGHRPELAAARHRDAFQMRRAFAGA